MFHILPLSYTRLYLIGCNNSPCKLATYKYLIVIVCIVLHID